MRLTTNGALGVELEGSERVWGFRRKLTIPVEHIAVVSFHESYEDPGGAWRVAGTALPRRLYAGNFRRKGKPEFWYLRKPSGIAKVRASNVLEIETSTRPSRLLLTVTAEEAAAVIAWFESTSRRG